MGALSKGVALSKLKDLGICKQRHDKAQGLVDQGKLSEAVKLFRENLDWSLANLGPDHNRTVYDQETLAYAVSELGHQNAAKNKGKNDEEAKKRIKALFNEAHDLDKTAMETRIRVEGTDPPSKEFLETQRNLANDHLALGQYNRADELFRENYEARRTHPELGEDHDSTLRAGHDLAMVWHNRRKYEMASALNQKILDARIRLAKPEADIEKSRDALYWNKKMLEDRKKDQEKKNQAKKDQEKKAAAPSEKDSGQWNTSKQSWDSKAKEQSAGRNNDAGWQKESKPAGNWDETKDQNAWSSNDTGKWSKQDAKWGGEASGKKGEKSKTISTPPPPIPNITFKYVDPRASGISQDGSDVSSIKSGSDESNNPNLPVRRGSGQGNRPSTPRTERPNTEHRNKPRPVSIIQEPDDSKQKKTSENLKPTDNNSRNTPGPSRARSLSNSKDKDKEKPKTPQRAKSTSPPAADRQHYPQLSDAGPGSDDKASIQAVNNWFYSLNQETQALLKPNRRARGKRVKIAILDTGIDIGHPYFAEDQAAEPSRRRIKSCEDFLDPSGTAQDVCGHGTHCVGLLRKVAPEADIYVARVAKDFDGDLDPDVVAQAIYRACRDKKDENGKKNWNVDIITMSFGFHRREKVVHSAIQEALARPVLIFAAASNSGTQREVTFPAWLSGVMCINSATANGPPSLFNPDVKPPNNFSILGENVKSAWIRTPSNPNAERVMSGTSVATPIAAAVAALVLEYVLQNDPKSVLIEQFEDLKHPDGMPEVFAKMVRSEDKHLYRNVVPWVLLSASKGRMITSGKIEEALWNFRAE